MSVTVGKLDIAIEECERFLKRAKECKRVLEKNEKSVNIYAHYFPKETGAVRRSSMDLTRVLVDIRK